MHAFPPPLSAPPAEAALPNEEVRALRPGEEDEFLHVLCAAFGLNAAAARPLFRADPFFDLSHKRVLWTPDLGIVSVLTVIPCPMTLGKSVVPVGGIAGVATRPDWQGRGLASRLLVSTIAAMGTELPYPAAALLAADARVYERLGWAQAFHLSLWTGTPAAQQQNSQAQRLLRPISPQKRDALHALHTQMTAERPGACVRDSRRWHIIDALAPAREAWGVYDEQDALTGYVLFDRLDEPAPAFRIVELLAETDDARAALKAFLSHPPFACARWEWPAQLSDFCALNLDTSALQPTPAALLRVCHLPRALAVRHAADFAPHLRGGKSLTLHITDDAHPANNAPVLLNERGVHVGSLCANAIVCDVRTLAQLYTGFCSAREAAREGRLSASSDNALELAQACFPHAEPCLYLADQF